MTSQRPIRPAVATAQTCSLDAQGLTPPQPRAAIDFVVIGAMRAGTTTLYDILSRHPDIAMSRDKETDYFIADKNHGRGLEWYNRQFDPSRPLRGDISPNYSKAMDFPGVPRRLAELCPDARLIYVLRDPVSRAVSQYRHSWNMGLLRVRPEELNGSREYLSLINASSYAAQLDAWRAYFPADRILVIDFDAMLKDPQQHVDKILRHVGAAPMQVPNLPSRNTTDELSRMPQPLLRLAHGRLRPLVVTLLRQQTRTRLKRLAAIGPRREAPEFPEEFQARMRAHLAADAARLRQMTGLELAHWTV